MRYPKILPTCFCVMSILSGCGGGDSLGRQAISGAVKLNGTPVQQGSISFEPAAQGTTSSGALIKDGKYSIPRDQGLPVGKYRVVINATAPGSGEGLPADGLPGDPIPEAEELIPPDWNVESANFIEVKQETGVFNFDVTTKK